MQFVNVFLETPMHTRAKVIGANFLFMSDLSDAVTVKLAASYKMPDVDFLVPSCRLLGCSTIMGFPSKAGPCSQRRRPRLPTPSKRTLRHSDFPKALVLLCCSQEDVR